MYIHVHVYNTYHGISDSNDVLFFGVLISGILIRGVPLYCV